MKAVLSEFEIEIYRNILDWGCKYIIDFVDLSTEELTELYWTDYLKD